MNLNSSSFKFKFFHQKLYFTINFPYQVKKTILVYFIANFFSKFWNEKVQFLVKNRIEGSVVVMMVW
jgi:hypothetical protein